MEHEGWKRARMALQRTRRRLERKPHALEKASRNRMDRAGKFRSNRQRPALRGRRSGRQRNKQCSSHARPKDHEMVGSARLSGERSPESLWSRRLQLGRETVGQLVQLSTEDPLGTERQLAPDVPKAGDQEILSQDCAHRETEGSIPRGSKLRWTPQPNRNSRPW